MTAGMDLRDIHDVFYHLSLCLRLGGTAHR